MLALSNVLNVPGIPDTPRSKTRQNQYAAHLGPTLEAQTTHQTVLAWWDLGYRGSESYPTCLNMSNILGLSIFVNLLTYSSAVRGCYVDLLNLLWNPDAR